MIGSIILGTILATPLLLGLIFRVNCTYLFFSVMAGELLGRYFGHNLNQLISNQLNNDTLAAYGELLLIVLPLVLTAIFLRKSLTWGKSILHIIPFIVTGVVFAAFVLPVLPADLQNQIQSNMVGDWLLHLNRAIVGAVIISQLITLWLLNRPNMSKHKKHY